MSVFKTRRMCEIKVKSTQCRCLSIPAELNLKLKI